MNTIYLDNYMYALKTLGRISEGYLSPFSEIKKGIPEERDVGSLAVGWGHPIDNGKCGIAETGFFWDAMHIDTVGSYQWSSLNTPEGICEIESFTPKKSALDIVLRGNLPTSKYSQGQYPEYKEKEVFSWDGVVLALQNPGDRSVRKVASPEEYMIFIEEACRYYGKKLFLKLHPWNTGEIEEVLQKIANRYGCIAAKVDHRVIENCEFVLIFNSSFAVDCMIRSVRVAQYAPGTFWQTGAVKYTKYGFPFDICDSTISRGHKLCDFLVWRYCFNMHMSVEMWVKMLREFSCSTKMFPLSEEFCYAENCEDYRNEK